MTWIDEKFRDWIEPTSRISADRLSTNVMLYRLTATAGPVARP